MSRLAPTGALLGEPDLREQRPHRRDGSEALEALAHPLQESDVRRAIARDVAEGGDRLHIRIVVQPARELPHSARPEHVLGLQAEQEVFQVLQAIEGSHGSREGTGRRPVDPPHA
jgi:hypothetical protein